MSELYSTKVTATGGRQGEVRSEDGILSLDLAPPQGLGGPGGKTNPEQMFAGGFANFVKIHLKYLWLLLNGTQNI